MWTKRPRKAFLIVVSIRNKNRRKWLIPIPVWVVEDTFEAVQDIAWVGERILKLSGKHDENKQADRDKRADSQWRQYIIGMPVSAVLQAVSGIIRELRTCGRFRMIEVEDKAIQIYVDLF
ncbi:MAG: hypothetical protein FNP40_15335 [Dehalobacter sp. 4CP]|uniref:hypothetical protein n=1 Tax=Dehalobacter sp. CP TaxID=2594474 RepID=UPI0013CD477A|nr:hypothetical protein [Dehalobacter sp. 4CP]